MQSSRSGFGTLWDEKIKGVIYIRSGLESFRSPVLEVRIGAVLYFEKNYIKQF
jgi:hypothetical protein